MDAETKTAFAELRQVIVEMQQENRRQFDRIDARFERLEGRMDHMDGRIEHMDGRIDQLAARSNQMESRIDRLDRKSEERHQETRRHMGVVAEQLEHKIATLVEGFQFMKEKVDRNKADCDGKAEDIDVRVTRLEAANSVRRRRR